MFIPIKFMLDQARSDGYGFLRVVVTNLEEIEAALAAAEETRSPIAFAVNEPEGEFPRYRSFESLVMGAAAKSEVPVGVQFDHTENMTLILRAIRGGYNGIMVDASHHPFEENVAITRKVVEMCHPLNILVEGEVGIITRTWDDDSEREKHQLTDAEGAKAYVERTGVDALAISIGEVSGFDHGDLRFDRLREIKAKLGDRTHLCLHGVSFITDEDIRMCIAEGINYFGCATEFRYAFFQKLDEVRRKEGPKMVDPTLLFAPARAAMKEKVMEKIRLLGSEGRSNKVIAAYFSEGRA
ncbi:MAG: class II fructose-bisphosphate aldolase [Candidatus Latescibacterota bacterium]